MQQGHSYSVFGAQLACSWDTATVWLAHKLERISNVAGTRLYYGYATLMIWLAKKLERTSNVAGTQL